MSKIYKQLDDFPLSRLHLNKGQILDVPKNARFIKDTRYEDLKRSIQADPEMRELREVVAYDNDNDEYVIIMGNMRYRAMKELGFKTTDVKLLPHETPAAKLRAYAIKDNIAFGQNDWDALANEWEIEELKDFGLECDFLDVGDDADEQPPLELDADKKEKPYSLKITFATKEQLDTFRDSYEQQLKTEFEGITISVSGGEL
jgi:hypothetical protein